MPLALELQELGIQLNSTGYGSHKSKCPKCWESRKNKADESLYVNIKIEDNKDRAAVRCYNCGWTAAVPKVFQATTKSAPKKVAQKPYKKPEYVPPTGMAQVALDWFQERAIPPAIVAKNKIKYDTATKEIQFPYFSPTGEVVNIKYRKLDEKKFRMFAGGKLMLYGLQNLNPDYGTCILTEGENDALALQACGFENVFSVPNGAAVTDGDSAPKLEYLANSEDMLKGFNKIFLCCDMDEAGQSLEYELARRLGFGRCLRVELPLKDANEVLMKRGVDELCAYIHEAQPFPLSGISTWADLERDVFAFYDGGARPGHPTGWDNVDNYYTVREGELTVVTGVPSSGKSEFIDALLVNLAKSQGWCFGIFSPENMPLTEHISKLCSKYLEKPYTKSSYTRFTRTDLAEAMAWGHSHFYHIIQQQVEDKATIEWILEKAQGLVYRYGIKGLVIDPYNEIEHNRKGGQSETEYISEMLAKVKRFARSLDIHVWVIAHPAKPNHVKNTKNWVPNLYDISGGANWRNKCDAGIIIHRNEKSDNDREVRVIIDKIRFRQVGKRGETKLYYDPYTGVYKVPADEGVVRDFYEPQED
jgi:twinkle protein